MFTKSEIKNNIKRVAKEIKTLVRDLNSGCICISNANAGIQLVGSDKATGYLNIIKDGVKKVGYNFGANPLTTPIYRDEDAQEIADWINSNDERKVKVVRPQKRENLESLLELDKNAIKMFGFMLKELKA